MTYESIRYGADIRRKCRAALEKVFPKSGLQLSAPEDKRKIRAGAPFEVQVQRSGTAKMWTDAQRGRDYVLAPIVNTALPSPKYWFALRLDFVPDAGDHVLRQASLLIFYGEAIPQPFVRAEWDNAVPDGEHAQPHWHIYGSTMDQTALGFPAPSGGEYPVEKSARIHYAMSATWRLHGSSPTAHWKPLDSVDALANWIAGCLQYLVTQLIYFERKQVAPPTKSSRFSSSA